MIRATWLSLFVIAVAVGTLTQCEGSGGAGDCTPGAEACECLTGECFPGLECVRGTCVSLGGDTSQNPTGDGSDVTGGLTDSPTGGLTESPTSVSTSVSTSGPTSDPTGSPTGSPTGDPTGSPTGDPTGSPTGDPGTTSGPGTDTNPDPTDPVTTMPGNCKQLDLDKVPANIMLVVDRSGSMDGTWDQGQSKWSSVHETLTAAISQTQAKVKFGLMMFPSSSAGNDYSEAACVTNKTPEVPLGLGNGANISAALPDPFGPANGGSPTARGLTGGLNALKAAPASEGRAMVFIGDGPFNCIVGAPDNTTLFEKLDYSPHTIVAGAWDQDGIPTVVVGVGVSEDISGAVKDGNPDNAYPYGEFESLALEGGRPRSGPDKFYAANSEGQLAAFMVEAIDRANTCELELGLTPNDPESTVVKVNGVSYAYSAGINCTTDSGWIYGNGSNTRIQLCGSACAALKSIGEAEVDVDC